MRGLAQQYLLFGIWECSHELSRRLDSYYGILPMLTRPLQEILGDVRHSVLESIAPSNR